jgi:hypothetical protein
VLGVVALCTVFRKLKRPAPPVEQQSKFVAASPDTTRAPILDPRGTEDRKT